MIMTLKGIFKGENKLRWNCVPLEDQNNIGIPTRRWISRILYHRCEFEKQESGFLFARDNGIKASIGDYDPMFRNLLEQGQNMHPEFFTTGFFIGDYILRRTPRRGATTEAENKNVATAAIELINRWRKREAERGTESGLYMRQVYTQVSRSVVASLRFSRSH